MRAVREVKCFSRASRNQSTFQHIEKWESFRSEHEMKTLFTCGNKYAFCVFLSRNISCNVFFVVCLIVGWAASLKHNWIQYIFDLFVGRKHCIPVFVLDVLILVYLKSSKLKKYESICFISFAKIRYPRNVCLFFKCSRPNSWSTIFFNCLSVFSATSAKHDFRFITQKRSMGNRGLPATAGMCTVGGNKKKKCFLTLSSFNCLFVIFAELHAFRGIYNWRCFLTC